MIEMQRTTPTRILKNRDVLAANNVRSASMELDSAASRPTAPPPAPSTPSRCVAKEARLVTVEDGSHAVEVRCSCGEWTRVELQVASATEVAR